MVIYILVVKKVVKYEVREFQLLLIGLNKVTIQVNYFDFIFFLLDPLTMAV